MTQTSQLKQIARNEIAIYQHPSHGVIELSGEDCLTFLHNQSTNEIQSLQPGQGCDTVFVNATARTLDLATVYVTPDRVLLLVSPNRRQFLMEWLDRYLFPMDQVKLNNVSEQYQILTLLGEKSHSLVEQWGLQELSHQPFATHQTTTINDIPVRIAVGSRLAIAGYTILVETQYANSLQQTITEAGATPITEQVWEELTLEQGKPLPDYELTEDYNPLEAGLWQAISFHKGCYIGQETIARLNTYKGVKQRLWGIRLSQMVDPETPITVNDKKVGKLTRVQETDQGIMGLGYIRTKAGGEGLTVQVGEATGEVFAVPFLTHEYAD